jgi:hypothetical protein
MAYPPINASPTKEFFITILVRDVTLDLAIAEMVDNCVDGAKRIRDGKDFQGLKVAIRFDKDSFSIEDNCGGIPVDIATKYAFRFGRTDETPTIHRPIGQFGVGMKRALFKLGTAFHIESIAPDSSFTLNVEVNKWKAEDEWEFTYHDYHRNQHNKEEDWGTKVSVAPLHDSIVAEFQLKNFETRLIETIQAQNSENLQKEMVITINGIVLEAEQPTLLHSSRIKPLHISKTISVTSKKLKQKAVKKSIKVDLYAGVSERFLLAAGWYVFCNGRLVLKADKSRITGWGEEVQMESEEADEANVNAKLKTPRAHWQFARFRGYVYFESEDGSLLPWNTTKSSVDTESPIYQAIKLEMIGAMRQVIDFLNKVDQESESGETRLEDALKAAKPVKVSKVPSSARFVFPQSRGTAAHSKTQRITYFKPTEEVDRVKEEIGATNPKQVGEKTFEYFLEREVDNSE